MKTISSSVEAQLGQGLEQRPLSQPGLVSNQHVPGGFRSSEGLPASAQLLPAGASCLQSDHRGFLSLLLVSTFSQEMRGLRKESNKTQHRTTQHPTKQQGTTHLVFPFSFATMETAFAWGLGLGMGLVVTLQNVPQQLGKY